MSPLMLVTLLPMIGYYEFIYARLAFLYPTLFLIFERSNVLIDWSVSALMD